MSGPNGDEFLPQTLDPTEQRVVNELNNWLEANPNAEWKQHSRFPYVYQCSETKLREILQQLAQVSSYCIFETKLALIIAELSIAEF